MQTQGQSRNGDLTIKKSNPRGGRNQRPPINENIDASEVRLIDSEGNQVGIVPLEEALEKAAEVELDLVQMASDADPVVCRIMDYGKKLFEEKKARAAAKKKQKQIQIKEVKFRPGTEEGDYQVKLRNLIRFLEQGDKGKVTIRFRGREMAHQEIGMQLMQRVESDIEELAQVEQRPKMEGRQMTMVVAPRKKK
ncbi:translation initiation factor IF-3 [Vreelandella utahensis]|uniref:translation initiation factor IF-3 n=1 Tax=Vreelandella halophila TaxID=86177 RepID=UPI003CCA3154